MFKKLKDKLAEEISPQRIQQLTQSVTERIQNSVDSNVFSIAEDDTSSGVNDNDSNFTNVNLQYPRRRNSNTSIASDVSFLPRYETNFNPYHLQSDLDISASEIEDNASSSSQLGHVSKEQVHSAFQKAQLRYHKYRGRYTDLANHYKELEKENSKMKAVLVDQQDKAIRRMSELREQCSLSQKAKADLEQALRTEIEEKQIIISTLKDKVDLLQNQSTKNDNSELNDLKEKLEELKATAIVSQSRDNENKAKISILEKQLAEKQSEIIIIEERERGNNLKFANGKKELHAELESKEIVINNLQLELEANRKLNDTNLKSQNSKLIEKNEVLVKKCQDYEAELVKMEQYCLEINELKSERVELKKKLETTANDFNLKIQDLINENNELKSDLEVKNNEIEEINNNFKEIDKANHNLRVSLEEAIDLKTSLTKQFETDRIKIQDDTKESLLNLEAKVKHKFDEEYKIKENELTADFEAKIQELHKDDSATKQLQLKIVDSRHKIDELNKLVTKLTEDLEHTSKEFNNLDIEHLRLIETCNNNTMDISQLKNALQVSEDELSNTVDEFHELKKKEKIQFDAAIKASDVLRQEKSRLEDEIKLLKAADWESQLENSKKACSELKSELKTTIEELEKTKRKSVESLESLESMLIQKTEERNNILQDLANLKKTNEHLLLEKDSLYSSKNILLQKSDDYAKTICDFNENIKPNFEAQIMNLNQQITNLKELENRYKLSMVENSELKETIKNFNNLELQANNLNQQLKDVENKYKIALDENNDLKKAIVEIEDFNKNTKSNMESQINNLNQQILDLKDVENRYKLASEENLDLKEAISKLEKFNKNIKPNLELQINNLNQQIDKLKDAENRYKLASQENTDLKETISKLEEFNKNIKPNLELQINNLNQQIDDLKDAENRYKLASEENTDLKQTISKLEEFNKNIKPNLELQINNLNQQIDELKDVENKYKLASGENTDLKETICKLEEFNKNIKPNLELQINNLNQQIDDLKDAENKYKLASEENTNLKETITKLEEFNKNIKPNLELQIIDLNKQIEELREVENKYKLALDENDNLKEEILLLEELQAKIETLNNENEVKIKKIAEANAEKLKLHTELKALETYKNQNSQLTKEITQMRATLDNLSAQNQASAEKHKTLKSIEKLYKETLHENQNVIKKLSLLENEITELNSRNTQISSDNRQLVKENETLIVDCAEYKIKYENFDSLKTKLEETIGVLNNANIKLSADYEALSIDYKNLGEQLQNIQSCQMPSNDVIMTDLQTKFDEMTKKYEHVFDENKSFKSEIAKCSSELQNLIVEKKKIETLLRDMEHNCTELSHERQLLKDEIVELKTAPINNHNDSDKRVREIEKLREKLDHYKSIDLTNRSSIEFYEDELQKMKNKNEKINRKLDETLVTLNHCADLSESTEIEYLKNVLYNYMLGKESLVMARVIAAVCKFDSLQTEAVLKHEQHKQSILGQLGIL